MKTPTLKTFYMNGPREPLTSTVTTVLSRPPPRLFNQRARQKERDLQGKSLRWRSVSPGRTPRVVGTHWGIGTEVLTGCTGEQNGGRWGVVHRRVRTLVVEEGKRRRQGDPYDQRRTSGVLAPRNGRRKMTKSEKS